MPFQKYQKGFIELVVASDYYKILGLERNASIEQVRKAFKQLARKYHPDVNQGNKASEEKFKNISEAYEVLSDPEKKKKYDLYGSADFQGFPGGGAYRSNINVDDLGDIFGDIFGGMGQGAARGRRSTSRHPFAQPGKDFQYQIDLDFLDAVNGSEKTIRVGSGLTLKVKIPQGIDNGGKIRLAGKGEPGLYGGPPGDLYIEVRVGEHPYFRRLGDDIELTAPITIEEALNGASIKIPTIDGSVTLKIPPKAPGGQRLRLKGKGVINMNTKQRGDQFVILQITLPAGLKESTRDELVKILKGKEPDPRAALWV